MSWALKVGDGVGATVALGAAVGLGEGVGTGVAVVVQPIRATTLAIAKMSVLMGTVSSPSDL
jgi:hypothetical protein